jgi:hypothetical protein
MQNTSSTQYSVTVGTNDGTLYGTFLINQTVNGDMPYADDFVLSLVAALKAVDWPAGEVPVITATKVENVNNLYAADLSVQPAVFE